MTTSPTGEVTTLLQRIADGHSDAKSRLADLVYQELRGIAARQLQGMRDHTLQPTALVHEAWLRLAGGAGPYQNRGHFLGVAAKAMRSVLVDHVRSRRAEKRGGQVETTPLDDAAAFLAADEVDLLDLDQALDELERDEPDLARWVEMRFFGGMTVPEIAVVDGISESTVERGWRFARARLRGRLGGEDAR
jgi:RNA polymerase sigma factor (TIGR02999 family)